MKLSEKIEKKEFICPDYCCSSCVNGECPKANQEKYEEYGCDVIKDCGECGYYEGCDNCDFNNTENCYYKWFKTCVN